MCNEIPTKIRESIHKTKWTGAICDGVLQGGRKFGVWLAVRNGSSTSSQISRYLHYIITWLQFASQIAREHCAGELRVYLFLTDAKKQIPDNDSDPIDTIHANTAFTNSCSKQNEIVIFRREEWFKVFLHETFHSLGLDFSVMPNDSTNQCILSHFPALDPNMDVRLYETYCEIWAELFHLMFRLFAKPAGFKPFSSTEYMRALNREQSFSIYQSNKLLRRANLHYRDLFSKIDERMMYRENTQAFSYYILKSVLLWHVDSFLHWCNKYCVGNPAPIQFAPENAALYCKMVTDLVKSNEYMEAHEAPQSRNVKNRLRATTMRMTLESIE